MEHLSPARLQQYVHEEKHQHFVLAMEDCEGPTIQDKDEFQPA